MKNKITQYKSYAVYSYAVSIQGSCELKYDDAGFLKQIQNKNKDGISVCNKILISSTSTVTFKPVFIHMGLENLYNVLETNVMHDKIQSQQQSFYERE